MFCESTLHRWDYRLPAKTLAGATPKRQTCRNHTTADGLIAYREAVKPSLVRRGIASDAGKDNARPVVFSVFWLFVLSAVSYLDRVNISIAGGAIVDAYHLTDVQLGKVFSALVAGYALFQTVGGHLADRFGPRRVLTGGVVWWGVFTALTALVPANVSHALLLFVAVRFLLGAGEAVIYPAANQFVARWIPVRERGIANGWIFAGGGRWGRPYATSRYLFHAALRLALLILGMRGGWTSGRWRLVHCGSRHSRATSAHVSLGTRYD